MGKFLTSFKFAWRGIGAHFGSQTNAKVQLGVAVLVVACGFVFGLLGLSSTGGLIGSLTTAVVGAVVLIWLVGMLKKN